MLVLLKTFATAIVSGGNLELLLQVKPGCCECMLGYLGSTTLNYGFDVSSCVSSHFLLLGGLLLNSTVAVHLLALPA